MVGDGRHLWPLRFTSCESPAFVAGVMGELGLSRSVAYQPG
jgi:hypothetical protein